MRIVFKRHFLILFFVFYALFTTAVLFYGDACGLFGVPMQGTDQLTMLKSAVSLYHGHIPEKNFYSPSYTVFLYLLVAVSSGKLLVMRLLQGILCAAMPVLVYKLCRAIRVRRSYSTVAALVYCLYGPACLLSLAMLRAIPLAMCFLLTAFFLARGFTSKKTWKFAVAGVFAGLCILGRENFIPVVFSPLALLVLKDIRKYFKYKYVAWYIAALVAVLLPVIIYNAVLYDSPTIVPGHLDNIFTDHHREAHGLGQMVVSVLKKLPLQADRFICSYEIDNSMSFYAHRDVIPFMWLQFIPYNVILALALVAVAGTLCLKRSRFNRGIILTALMAAAYVVSLLPFDIYYRYRIPIVPLLTVLAGAGVATIYQIKSWKVRMIPVVAVILIFSVTWTAPNKLRRPAERLAVAEVFIHNKDFDRANQYITQLEREKIPTRAVRLKLIRALYATGNVEAANTMYQRMKLKQ